ncbi:MAG TPA: FecR domain-containing protein [Rhizomicrobium sp.]|nr:FecR domain-containing protein [Rhizomicrobium sp.]
MSGSLIPSDDVQIEAALWLVRLRSDARTEAQVAAFREWIAADRAHAVAFEAVDSTWDISSALPRDLRGEVPTPAVSNRRKVMAGAAAIIGGAGAFTFWRGAEARTIQTEVGEQKHVSLDDGTRIFLDTDTRLVVQFNDSLRQTHLEYGRVNFLVASDPIRPFVVNAAKAKVIAAPSNMDVRLDGARLSVVLVKGSVDIIRASAQPEKLQAGERIVIDGQGFGRRDKPGLTPLLAWQTGQAVFEDGRLSDAAAEMNRYCNVKLVIPDSETGELRVSGVYTVGDNVAFASSVAKLLPVKLVQGEGRIAIVLDKSRQAKG